MIGLIWGQAHDRAIGADGKLPWHLPEDLALFRRVTLHSTVVMGRKTWESLPARFRPLPHRENIVVTTQANYEATGAQVWQNLQPLAKQKSAEFTWVIGGAQLYQHAINLADVLVVTELDLPVSQADAFAPRIDSSWQIAFSYPDRGWLRSENGINYRLTVYHKPQGVTFSSTCELSPEVSQVVQRVVPSF